MIGIATLCICLSMGFQHAVGSPITAHVLSLEAGTELRLHIVPTTWWDAALICQLEGGVLGTPTSVSIALDMLFAMEEHNIGSGGVFIGVNGLLSKGKSLDGLGLGDASLQWAAGRPDNADGAEDCMALTRAGALADVSCSRMLPFFCQNSETQSTSNINVVGTTEEAVEKPFDEISNDDAFDIIGSTTDANRYNPSTISTRSYDYEVDNSIEDVTTETVEKPFDEVSNDDDAFDIIGTTTDANQYNPSTISTISYDYEVDNSIEDVTTETSSTAVPEYGDYATTLMELPQCSNNEYEYDSSTGSCYKFHLSAKPWRKALATCHAEGGYLAIINSDTESKVLKQLYNKITDGIVTDCKGLCNPYYVSIGFRKWDDDVFATINGNELAEAGFDKWSPGEPNNYRGREDCGSIYSDGLLNDTPCLVSFPFICESDS